jgi:hypothetical protein
VGVGIGLWGRVSEACGAHLRSAPSKRRLKTLGLVEVVVGEGLWLGGIELWGLIEAVGEELRGGLFCNPCSGGTGAHHEFGLGRSPGRMEEGRRAGFADVGEDLADRLGVSQKRDEREGCLAGGAAKREDLVDPGEKSGPLGGAEGVGGWSVGGRQRGRPHSSSRT